MFSKKAIFSETWINGVLFVQDISKLQSVITFPIFYPSKCPNYELNTMRTNIFNIHSTFQFNNLSITSRDVIIPREAILSRDVIIPRDVTST